MKTRKVSVRIPETNWELLEQMSLELSHEMTRQVKPSELMRQAIEDFISKWRSE